MAKAFNEAGEEIEVFTAEDVAAAKTEIENQYKPQVEQTQKERDEARAALAERTGDFARFRKLNEDQVKQLSEKDRIIYENSLALAKANDDRVEGEKKVLNSNIDTALRAKVGTNDKLFEEAKKMWDIVGITAVTPEEIAAKTNIVLGALSQAQPDLIASSGFAGGSFEPPKVVTTEKSFADTPEGEAAAKELGLFVEPKK